MYKTGTPFLLLLMLLVLNGCAAGMQVVVLDAKDYAPTARVDVVSTKPDRPYKVIARFSGYISNLCPRNEPLCDLRKRAKSLGGDAVWVQRIMTTEYPDQWIMVEGRLTHIYPSQYTRMEGVIIRYGRD